MKRKYTLTVFVLLVMIFECNGHQSILGNILSTAHREIQSRVENVAGSVLGGFNLDIFGGYRQNRPQQEPQRGSEETIIVVVEEPERNNYGPPNSNNYGPINQGPPPHWNQHHNEPPPLNNNAPVPPQPPNSGHRPEYNDQNQDLYHNIFGNNPNTGNNQNENPNNNNNGNIDINGNRQYSKGSEENQANNNNPNNPYNGPNTQSFYNNPTTEYTNTDTKTDTNSSPMPNNNEINKGTEKNSDDAPLFVPLSPHEYIYGGDKINITAPKRDTEKTSPAESDDDDFGIDIRLKNE